MLETPGRARSFVEHACGGWGVDGEQVEVAVLLTSELVTNAVLHAPPPIEVGVSGGPGGVLVWVSDSSIATPTPGRQDAYRTVGRGLWLVGQLAAAWGFEAFGDGKRVWFLLTPGVPEPAGPGSSS